MNPQKHVTEEDFKIKPTQEQLNRWYKHTSNRERFISQNNDVYEDNIISPNPLD